MSKDMCSRCGNTKSKTFWDFKDGSVLCDSCNTKHGDEWANKISIQRKIVITILIVLSILFLITFLFFQNTPNFINQAFSTSTGSGSNNLNSSNTLQTEQENSKNGANTQTNIQNNTVDQPTYSTPDNSVELALQEKLKTQMDSCVSKYSTKYSEYESATKNGQNLTLEQAVAYYNKINSIYNEIEDIRTKCIEDNYLSNKEAYDKIYVKFDAYIQGIQINQTSIYNFLSNYRKSLEQATGTIPVQANPVQTSTISIDTSNLDQKYSTAYNFISQKVNLIPQINDQATLYQYDGDVRDRVRAYKCAALTLAKTVKQNLTKYSQSDLINVQNKIMTQTRNIQNISSQYYNASTNRHNFIHTGYQMGVLIDLANLIGQTAGQLEDPISTVDNLSQLYTLAYYNGLVIDTGWGMTYSQPIDSTLESC